MYLHLKIIFFKGYKPQQSNGTDMSSKSGKKLNEDIPDNTPDSDILIIVVAIGTLAIASFFLIVYFCCCRKEVREHRSSGNIFAICKAKMRRQPQKDTSSKNMKKNSSNDVTTNDVEMYEMYAGLNTKRPSALPNNYEALHKMSVQYEQIDSPLVFKFNVTHNNMDNGGCNQRFPDLKEESEDEEENHYQPTSGPFRLRSATELSAKFDSASMTAGAADTLSQQRLRTSTELSVISTSFGSSQNLFRKISDVVNPVISTPRFDFVANDDNDDDSEDQTQFATYVQLESSDGIYKTPSSVPKFEAPKDVPHSMQRDSYVAMDDDSKYDTMKAGEGPVAEDDDLDKIQEGKGVNGVLVGGENGYAQLSLDVDSESESECYEQLQYLKK